MSTDLAAIYNSFSELWPSGRKDFRTIEDASWKTYALVLRNLVDSGDSAFIEDRLEDTNRQVRAISARALGFLRSQDSVPALRAVLSDDAWATTRLSAADSLGMIYTDAATQVLKSAKLSEEDKDVSLHIDIALNRETGVEETAVEDLLRLNEGMLAAAQVAEPAPDFASKSGDGKAVNLNDYRNGGSVALYFLYGDG